MIFVEDCGIDGVMAIVRAAAAEDSLSPMWDSYEPVFKLVRDFVERY